MATEQTGGFIYDPVTGTPVDKATALNAQSRWLEIDEKATNAEQGSATALATLGTVRQEAAGARTAAQQSASSAAASRNAAEDAQGTADRFGDDIELLKQMAQIEPGSVVDAQTAILVQDPESETHARLNAQTAEAIQPVRGMTLGLPPAPLAGASVSAVGSAPRPFDMIGQAVYGHSGNGRLHASTDKGNTWTDVGPAPGFGIRMTPTSDGQMLYMTGGAIFKSSGWGTAELAWAQKVATSGATQFHGWSLAATPAGDRFLTTEYAAGSGYPDSRYARMSLDGGNTWTIAYDSVARHGQTAADGSHLHGCAYDQWADRWIISEGHSNTGDIGGIYVSEDNGATWTRAEGMKMNPAPTMIVPTDNGLVCASDHPEGGVYGVVRTAVPAQQLRRVWAWRPGKSGTLGFGVYGKRDPETGMVYLAYRTEHADIRPIILGGTATSGSLVYEWPGSFAAYDDIYTVLPIGGGDLLAVAKTGTTYHTIRGRIPGPTITTPSAADSGSVLGGNVSEGQSVAVGPQSVTSGGIRLTAVGAQAKASGQDSVALGQASNAAANGAVAIGARSSAAGANSLAIGTDTAAPLSQQIVVGKGATGGAGGGDSVTVGVNAKGRLLSVVLGTSAEVIGTNLGGTALGHAAKSHSYAVALGHGTETNAQYQVAVGPRSLMLNPVATEPPPPPANGGVMFVQGGALKYKGAAGTVTTIAPA